MPPEPPAPPISRRRLLAVSGATLAAGSAAALSACGAPAADGPSDEEQAAALNSALAEQLAVLEALRFARRAAPERAAPAIARLGALRQRSSRELAGQVEELGATATREPAPRAEPAESAVEALARQLDAAIAGQIAAIGELAPERRALLQRAIGEDAATLSVLRSVLGEPVAPGAFVFGTPAGGGAPGGGEGA